MKTATRTEPKVRRSTPETLSQAQSWDRNASRYRALGFCDPCASQAGWGHQLGFANVRPVGDCCRGRSVDLERGERAARWAAGPEEA